MDDWEQMENEDVENIKYQKKDEDGEIIKIQDNKNEVKKKEQIQEPKIVYSEKENIFKGLSFQQKRSIVTQYDLKKEKDFKDLGIQLAQKLQQGENKFGVFEFTQEILNGLQALLESSQNTEISNKLKVLSNDRQKAEKNEKSIKEQKEKELLEQQLKQQVQQKLLEQKSQPVADDDFM